MDDTSLNFVQGFRVPAGRGEIDLDVDGLSDSLLSRLIHLFRFGKS